MASESRATASNVAFELLDNSRMYAFFQAVRLLSSVSQNRSPMGKLGPAKDEPIRFRANASLAFPGADIENIGINKKAETRDDQFEMVVNFLGLYGPSSPLPTFYTEDILHSDEHPNNQRDFFDLFNHRSISLFYRIWEKYRYYIRYEKNASDEMSQYMFSLMGVGHPTQRSSINLDWRRLLSYLGVISIGCRSASVLQGIVNHYFGDIRVAIEQCVERFIEIDGMQLCGLGISNTTLGVDIYAAGPGSRIIDRNSKFRIFIGALQFKDFQKYLPPGERYSVMCDLVRFVMSEQYEFDIECEINAGEIPRLTLADDNPCRLDWSSWLGEPPKEATRVIIAA